MRFQRFIAFCEDERGQGLVEYALIISLISIVAIIGLTTLGKKSNNTLNSVANKLTD